MSQPIAPAAVLVVAAMLAACSQPPPEPPQLRPVRSATVVATGASRTRTFSGTARAGRETDLSFRVSGTVEDLRVKVGDAVGAGRIIAQLDRTDYEISVRLARADLDRNLASWRNAEADLERVRGLWENNNAPQNDLDRALAQAQSAQAQAEGARQALAQAERRLDYTSLRAPVAGLIAEAPVEINENVQQGQTIARMTSGRVPEVGVAIPGLLISQIREGDPVTVSVDALPGETFDAVVTEVGVATTGGATTFPVTVLLGESAADVRSGMAAEVTFRFGDVEDRDRIFVPSYAVGEDRAGRYVFVLEPAEDGVGVVRRTTVEVGSELTPEGRLEILSGLAEGQRLVTAGVRRLTDGQRVKLLAGEDRS